MMFSYSATPEEVKIFYDNYYRLLDLDPRSEEYHRLYFEAKEALEKFKKDIL